MPNYQENTVEHIAQSPQFRAQVREEYHNKCAAALVDKEIYSLVEALEDFTDYWTLGITMRKMPLHGAYIPVRTNIMTRPKFRNYDLDDELGKEHSYLTKDNHNIQPGFTEASTVRPVGMKPKLRHSDIMEAETDRSIFTDLRIKPTSKPIKRLAKKKHDKWRIVARYVP